MPVEHWWDFRDEFLIYDIQVTVMTYELNITSIERGLASLTKKVGYIIYWYVHTLI
jgi:hypothetical protein